MKVPRFIQTEEQWNALHNLMINCENRETFKAYLTQYWAETDIRGPSDLKEITAIGDSFTPVSEYTLLSPCYFEQSENDPTNRLKSILTRTYSRNGEFTTPLVAHKE